MNLYAHTTYKICVISTVLFHTWATYFTLYYTRLQIVLHITTNYTAHNYYTKLQIVLHKTDLPAVCDSNFLVLLTTGVFIIGSYLQLSL